jgi:hypothetical protein
MRLLASLLVLASTAAFAQTGAPKCPNLLIAFDVSGSMESGSVSLPGGGTAKRWVVGRDAIKQIIQSDPEHLRFGLELFGDVDSGGNCGISSPTCSPPTPETCNSVQCDYNTRTSIETIVNALTAVDVDGSTPTASAINTAGQRADMNDTTRPRYIILLTDGNPDTGNVGNCTESTGSTTTDYNNAITALNNIRTQKNVKTFVIGFAGGSADKLNGMAVAGGTQRNTTCDTANPCYYNATNATELNDALSAIVGVVGGELGGTACDDTCYGQGCPAGQVCMNSACAADPCAGVSCPAGLFCANGTCTGSCSQSCPAGQRCDNGTCAANAACATECTGRNQACVNGQCVENLCSGETTKIGCPTGYTCIANGCELLTATDGGTDGGTGGANGGGGCCSGAPSAFSALALAMGLSALAIRRRVRAR